MPKAKSRAQLNTQAIGLMKKLGMEQGPARVSVLAIKNKAAVRSQIATLQVAVAQMEARQVVTQQGKALGKVTGGKIGRQLSARHYYGRKQQTAPGEKVTAQQIMAMPRFSTKAKIVAQLDKVKPGHNVKSSSRKAVWARALAQAMSSKSTTRYVVDKDRRGKLEPTEANRKDARRIRNLMEKVDTDGKPLIVPMKGVVNPSDFGDSTTSDGMIRRSTFKKYINMYKKQVRALGLSVAAGRVGLKKKKKSAAPSPTLKKLAAALPQGVGRGYYIQKGRTVKRTVGGGPRGPGKIRPIAKGTVSYSKLSTADKRKVAAFLAEGQGKVLRGPGARKKIVLQQLVQVNMTKKQLAGVKQQAAKQQPKQQPKRQTSAQIAARYKGREGYRQIVKRANKQGVSTTGGTLAIAKRLAKQQKPKKASSGVTTQQVMKKKYNTIQKQLKAKGYTGKVIGVKKQVLAQQLAKLS